MPEYLAPGVYVEEISTGAKPIEGVSTSTAGFVGPTERGPDIGARLITSWVDFVRWYGTYRDRVNPNATHKYLPYAAQGFFANDGKRLYVARVCAAGATTAGRDLDGGGRIDAIGRGKWGRGIMYRIKPASLVKSTGPTVNWFRLTLLYYSRGVPSPFIDPTNPKNSGDPNLVQPDVTEDYDNLSVEPTDSNFAQSVVNGASRLVKLTITGRPTDGLDFDEGVFLNDGGDDGADDPAIDDYAGDPLAAPDKRSGLLALESVRGISILGAPDDVELPDLQDLVLQQCDSLKDRFGVFSVTAEDQNTKQVTDLQPFADSTFGAYYAPWVRVLAPHTPEGHLLVPPTGHVAGIYARVDVERGVHKAPANEVVRGIITRDLPGENKPLRFIINKSEHDILNPKGVNVFRDFRDQLLDIRLYGARTMTGSRPDFKYINVRRLFIFLEQSIERGTQWVVFEPNYEQTWIAVRASITAFLRTVWRSGALQGATEREAFFVKCDRTTMTQDDLDNGRLIILIGVAPVKPAEFVIIRIQQFTVEQKN